MPDPGSTDTGIADEYAAAINGADVDALLALFADDAVLRNPAGTFEGTEQIRGFYEQVVLAGQARLTVKSVDAGDDGLVVAELAATSPLGDPGNELLAVDEFRLDENGRIRSLDITYR